VHEPRDGTGLLTENAASKLQGAGFPAVCLESRRFVTELELSTPGVQRLTSRCTTLYGPDSLGVGLVSLAIYWRQWMSDAEEMMSSEIDYRSHGVPLETYELTRRDHQDQKMSESCRAEVEELAAKWEAEEAADPKLREGRRKNIERAIAMIYAHPTPDYQIMRWRVRLYCGHIVETSRHCQNDEPTRHGSSSMPCPECGMDPARIVAYEPVGLLAKPPVATTAQVQPKRPTRKELEERIARLEAELVAVKRRRNNPRPGALPASPAK
jgi:hypothetical protein